MTLTVASLCSGYEATSLGLALAGLPHRLAFVADPDPAAAKVLAHHHPDVPNLGDISKVDWTQVEPVDLLTAGYPCQPFSAAGRRLGTADERHIWPHVATAIGTLRPTLVLLENVRGHLTLGFDEVVRDLNWLGYDAVWVLVKASDVGAPHQRARLFVMGVSRGPFLCSRDHRRGGLHRDPDRRELPPSPSQGGDDGQGEGVARSDGAAVRRHRETGQGGDLSQKEDLRLVPERSDGSVLPPEGPAVLAGQARCGGNSDSVARDGGCGSSHAERQRAVERGDAPAGGDPSLANPGGESPWTRPGSEDVAGQESGRDLALGLVLGSAGQPVRPGGVRGEPAALWGDGRRPRLCPQCLGATILAWPAADPPRDAWRFGDGDSLAVAGTGELSLLPTPNAALGRGTGMPSSETAERRMYTEGRRFLDDAVALLPTPAAADGQRVSHTYERGNPTLLGAAVLLPTPTATPYGNNQSPSAGAAVRPSLNSLAANALLPTPTVADARGSRNATAGRGVDASSEWSPGWSLSDVAYADRWGEYAPAIARWEQVVGRPAPDPTEPGSKGQPRLSPAFVEWMQGLPAGYVTTVPGVSRNDALRLLGNANPPQQYAAAWTRLVAIVSHLLASEAAA